MSASPYLHFVLLVDPFSLFLFLCPVNQVYVISSQTWSFYRVKATENNVFNSSEMLEGGRSYLCPKRNSLRKHWPFFVPVLVRGRVKPDHLPLSSPVSGAWCSFPCTLFLGSSCSCKTHMISLTKFCSQNLMLHFYWGKKLEEKSVS